MLIELFFFLQQKLNKSLWKTDLHENINILCEKQTDETEKSKYLISRLLIMKTVSEKTACWASTVSKLCEIIEKLQKRDVFSQCIFRKVKNLKTCKWKSVSKQDWSLNEAELLKLQSSLYVSSNSAVKMKLFYWHHDDVYVDHYDCDKTASLLQHKYYWYRLNQNVKKFVKFCFECQKMQTSRHKKYDKMSFLSTLKESWKHLFMNFITNLSSLLYREIVYDVILIVMNKFIKMIRYFFVKQTISVSELADFFANEILKLHKKSQFIVMNRSSLFIS